jgi:hypothetical protein
MKSTQMLFRTVALSLLAAGTLAQAATTSGTVTNKTTGKPSAGDTVVLVDVQAGMGEAAHATTDANGKYTLNEPGAGPYLIRATHQGATYFIGAPTGSTPGEITVYDAAAKVEGIALNADVIEFETGNGQLFVNERYFVKNASNPARTQNGPHGFEVVIPADAVLDGAAATRPGGLPTNASPEPAGQKGHYYINVPIQPSLGEKDTLFDLRYHLPYSGGKYVFTAKEMLAADNIAVLLPKSMTFTPSKESGFLPIQEDPALLTFVVKNAPAGKAISFTISGEGSMPRENQGTPAAQQPTMGGADAGSADASAPNGGQPGGGMANPIATPDPLTKYKWWILASLALLLVAAAAFLLRKPAAGTGGGAVALEANASPAARNAALLHVLKEELFAVESEKIAGTLSESDYATTKAALEIVLKRALKKG